MTAPTPSPRPHLAVRPEWLALQREEILEPELPIVDAHHHLWDHTGNRYFVFDMADDIASGHHVVATVAVECGAMYRADASPERRPVGETEFLNGMAAISASGAYGSARVCAGIVGHVDLRLGAAREKDKILPVRLTVAGVVPRKLIPEKKGLQF